MKQVICRLPNAALLISGVAFTKLEEGGVISEPIADEAAEAFAEIEGYELHAPAPAKAADKPKKPATAPTPAPTPKPAAAEPAPAAAEPIALNAEPVEKKAEKSADEDAVF